MKPDYNDVIIAQDTYSPIENIKLLRPDVVLESGSHPDELIQFLQRNFLRGKLVIKPSLDLIGTALTVKHLQ